jgi:hypothetical protein
MEFPLLLLIAPAIFDLPFRTLHQRETRFKHSFSSSLASYTSIDNILTKSLEPAEISTCCFTQCKSEIWFEAPAISSYPYFSEVILLRKNRGVTSNLCSRASDLFLSPDKTNLNLMWIADAFFEILQSEDFARKIAK